MSPAKIRDIRDSSADIRRTSASVDSHTVTRILEDWHGAAVSDAAEIVRSTGLDCAPYSSASSARDADLANALERIRTYGDMIEQTRSITERRASLRVLREPRTYGPGSEFSFFRDHFWRCYPGHPNHVAAGERLERHAREVAVEIRDATSAEGQRAIRAAGTLERSDVRPGDREVRAITTATSSGGPFVTPQYLLEQGIWAMYRTYPASFTEQAVQVRDPGYGLTMHLPSFTGPLSVGQQVSENSGATDSSPGGSDLTFTLLTALGEVVISQQLLDRSGPDAYGFDKICHEQLQEDLRTETDTMIVTQAISVGGTVAGDSSTFSVVDLWGDIANAKSQIATAAGSELPATHIFATPKWAEYMLGLSDANGRPLLLPTSATAALPIQLAPDGGPPPGFTGDRLLGTPLFADGNIPTSGGNTQFVVANMGEVFVQRSEPVLRTIPETFATTLSVVVQAYQLFGVILRHTGAVQTIAGSAYPASPSFA